MAIPTYNQKSGFEVTIEWESDDGQPSPPNTTHWRLTCGDRVIQDWTAGTVLTDVADGAVSRAYTMIDVPGPLNALVDSTAQREFHTLTYAADKDTDREWSDDWDFYVKKGGR